MPALHCVLSASGQRLEHDEAVVGVAEEQEQLTVTASKPNFERLARFVGLLGVRSDRQYTPTAEPGWPRHLVHDDANG